MENKKKSILAAVDSSMYSANCLKYLAELFMALKDVHIHLLYIVPAGELPLGREWMDELDLLTALGPAARKRYASGRRYLDDAVSQLDRLGFPQEQVSTSLELSRQGVAADIISAARSGKYDALVIGRRGLSKVEEIFMGSVSQTILDKCYELPIWMVDGQVPSRKFLVPVDGSFHSLMAVDHLAYFIGNNPYAEVTLFHSSVMFLGGVSESDSDRFPEKWDSAWCEKYLSGPDYLYTGPKQILMESGFPEERIHWVHTFKGLEPARQIIRQALIDDYGTIVMGRRGKDIKKGIFRGVTDRVLFMAEQVAIWVCG